MTNVFLAVEVSTTVDDYGITEYHFDVIGAGDSVETAKQVIGDYWVGAQSVTRWAEASYGQFVVIFAESEPYIYEPNLLAIHLGFISLREVPDFVILQLKVKE